MLAALVAFPDLFPFLLRDRGAGIDDSHTDGFGGVLYRDRDGLAFPCVVDGIVEEVTDDLADFEGVDI